MTKTIVAIIIAVILIGVGIIYWINRTQADGEKTVPNFSVSGEATTTPSEEGMNPAGKM